MGMINGKRILSQLVAGTMSGAQLQTELGTATSLASFSEAINDAENARLIAESRTAMTALTASVIAMTAAGASSVAVKAIAVVPAAASAVCAVKTALMAMGTSSGALLRFFRWTQRTTPINFVTLAYGNNMLVGWGGTSVYSSSDLGLTWTARTNPNATSITHGFGLTFGNGRFVAVSVDGVANTLGCQSVDGITWTAMPLPSSKIWQFVSEVNGCFVAFHGSNDIAAYSLNGTSWTSWTPTGFSPSLLPRKTPNGFISGNGSTLGFTTINSFGPPIFKSADYVLSTQLGWTPVYMLYGNGILLVFRGAGTTNYARSLDDGATFVQLNLPVIISNPGSRSGGYSNGAFYLMNPSAGTSYFSSDGLAWAPVPSNLLSNDSVSVDVGGLTFLTASGTNFLATAT